MHKVILRTIYAARNSTVNIYECCMLAAKCDNAAFSSVRAASGVRVQSFSTSSIGLCEKKNEAASSQQGDKTNADEPTETTPLPTKEAEADNTLITITPNIEEPALVKADDGNATQQPTDVKNEKDVKKPKPAKPPAPKTGKENLLELLGAMKVDITTKRRLKNLKMNKQVSEPTPKSKPETMESTISMFQKAAVEAASQSETLDRGLVAAASAAASTLPNRSQAESELLRQLRKNEAVTEAQKKGEMNKLGDIIADMRVGKSNTRQGGWSANQIRFDEDGKGYTQEKGITAELEGVRRRRTLFSGKRLNIFSSTTEDEVESAVARPSLWEIEFANRLSEVTNQLPRNRLEEMIQWTKEGKLWQYPINNEVGLEEESSVSFHEHIFLDEHLKVFPNQGPVRHFMELVVAGLSKNPYLTVQQKKEHIAWFRDYFQEKEQVLKEADVYLN